MRLFCPKASVDDSSHKNPPTSLAERQTRLVSVSIRLMKLATMQSLRWRFFEAGH